MAITSTKLMSETILYVRDRLRTNITDPEATKRATAKQQFVMTSYPRRNVFYPLITIKGLNASGQPMGQGSETSYVTFSLEVRIWGRTEKEKNNLFDSVYTYLQHNQIPSATVNTSQNVQLFGFKLLSATEYDEPGEEGIKSRIANFEYKFIAT